MNNGILLKLRVGSFMKHKHTKVAQKSTKAEWNTKFQFQLSQEEKETRKLGRVLKTFTIIKHQFVMKKLCQIFSFLIPPSCYVETTLNDRVACLFSKKKIKGPTFQPVSQPNVFNTSL